MGQELVAGSEPMPREGLKERVAAYERQLIVQALLHAGGNQRRAAAALGCLPTTLNEKMRRLGLRGQSQPEWPPRSLAPALSPDPNDLLPPEL